MYDDPPHAHEPVHILLATSAQNMFRDAELLCKIWDSHGDDYEECRLLGCYTVWLSLEPMVLRNLSFPSSM
jgi:hypothetical protein